MKILCLAPENDWFVSGVERILKSMGHSIRIFIYRKSENFLKTNYSMPFLYQLGAIKVNKKLKKEVITYRPDIILSMKAELIFPETIKWIKNNFKIPCILWFQDDPQLFYRFSRYIAPFYDYVFTSSEDIIPKYKEIGVENVSYIPFACDTALHKKINLTDEEKREYGSDICFVAKFYPERERALKFILNYDLKIYGPHWYFSDKDVRIKWTGKTISGEQIVKVYNASKIVLNIHDNEMKYGGMKANLRVFETTGCGAFLLTDKPKGLEDLFRIGKEVVCYKTKKELIELIDFYLENEKERKRIAKNGQKRAYKEHTIEKRVKKIFSVL